MGVESGDLDTNTQYLRQIRDGFIDIGSPVRVTNDTTSKSIPVPAAAKAFACQAEGGDIRLEIDGAASATSTLRVPEDAWLIYPIQGGSQTLFSYGAVGTYSNMRFLG
jgi:hypothetical protein